MDLHRNPIDGMQKVLDDYLAIYNTKRPHQGRGINGRTPITAFKAGLPKPTQQKKEKTPPQKPDNQLAAQALKERQLSGDYCSCTYRQYTE